MEEGAKRHEHKAKQKDILRRLRRLEETEREYKRRLWGADIGLNVGQR